MFPSIAFPSGELTSPWLLSSGGSSIGGSGGTSRDVSVLLSLRDIVAKQFETIVAIYRSTSFSPLQIKIMRTFGVDLVKDCSGLRSFMNISFVQKGDKNTSIFYWRHVPNEHLSHCAVLNDDIWEHLPLSALFFHLPTYSWMKTEENFSSKIIPLNYCWLNADELWHQKEFDSRRMWLLKIRNSCQRLHSISSVRSYVRWHPAKTWLVT